MKAFILSLCCIITFNAMTTMAVKIIFEATSARESNVTKERSNAHVGKTEVLETGENLTFYLCLRQKTALSVSNVRFSNDGGPDVVDVRINNKDIGYFQSSNSSHFGQLWNVFHVTGQVGQRLVFKQGWHFLELSSRSGDGLEIDYVELDVSDETISKDILSCSLMCTNLIPPVSFTTKPNMHNATLIQKSYPTKCAEEDNINIPVFLKNVLEYRITASLPQYRTFLNERLPDTSSCPTLSPTYWRLANISIPQSSHRASNAEVTVDFLFGRDRPYVSQVLLATFKLKGKSTGYIDADIGSLVTIQIKPSASNVTVRLLYKGRANMMISLGNLIFLPGETTKEWNIPDFSWTEFSDNNVLLSISGEQPFMIVDINLQRRYMKPERIFTIFKSHDLAIEGVEVDFWWRAPEKMVVYRTDDGQRFPNVAFFKISRAVPWAKGMAEIFVLYQDGNVRLLELPPSGLDWIPFGTSVIVGQTNSDDFRPSAPIVRVDLSPATLNMTLYYKDGGTSKLDLSATATETVLRVSEIDFKRDTGYLPFATFRSMYVKDGNSDSDSVLVDGRIVSHVANGWTSLIGQSFMLYRRCESKHLTLSPDIRLDVEHTVASKKYETTSPQLWHEFMKWRRRMG